MAKKTDRFVMKEKDLVRGYPQFVAKNFRARKAAQGEKFSPADFISGAMCVYYYMQSQLLIPSNWIFGSGDDI